jgi:type IV pilus assembly protein PilX
MHPLVTTPRGQRGAVLIVSMLLLLVMTVLALAASQATQMQERMAGNARDLDLAFQAGEAGVRAAEARIQQSIAPKRAASLICAQRDECDAVGREDSIQDYEHRDLAWWKANAYEMEQTLGQVSDKSRYVIERWADVPDTLTRGSSMQKSGTIYYVATSHAQGATDSAVAMMETSYAVRY